MRLDIANQIWTIEGYTVDFNNNTVDSNAAVKI